MNVDPRDEEEVFDATKLKECLEPAREAEKELEELLDEVKRDEQVKRQKQEDYEKHRWFEG